MTVPLSAIDHVIGHPGARVAVVEYGDFECPNCKQAAPAVGLLLKRFAGQIQVGFRHYPLEEVHPHALHAALAAEAAGGQGKFWPMHDLLFDNQAHLKLPQLRRYAEAIELDMCATMPRWLASCTSFGMVRLLDRVEAALPAALPK